MVNYSFKPPFTNILLLDTTIYNIIHLGYALYETYPRYFDLYISIYIYI